MKTKDLLIRLLDRSHSLLMKDVDGIGHDQALSTLFEGGNHLNWLVGHIVGSRDVMLETLGAERVRSKEEDAASGMGSKPAGPHDARPFAEQVADLVASHERLRAALEAVTDEGLAAPLKEGTVEDRLLFFLWHEAYHTGQATLYRRGAGLKSPIG